MQYSTLTLAALSIVGVVAQYGNSAPAATSAAVGDVSSTVSAATSASTAATAAGVQVHVVQVGSNNGSLVYSPNNVVAAVGDMVQFQFGPANHTVTQSTFDAPCTPIKTVAGIFSGFMPVKATDTEIPTYSILVNNTTPIWLYCSQAKHCQKGMVMVINENVAANASRSLAGYASLASQATSGAAPVAPADGTASSVAASSAPSATSSSTKAPGTNAASSVKVGSGLGLAGVLAAGFMLL